MRVTRKNHPHPFSFLRFAEKKTLEKIFKSKIGKFQKSFRETQIRFLFSSTPESRFIEAKSLRAGTLH